jgi:hypothetical protein
MKAVLAHVLILVALLVGWNNDLHVTDILLAVVLLQLCRIEMVAAHALSSRPDVGPNSDSAIPSSCAPCASCGQSSSPSAPPC